MTEKYVQVPVSLIERIVDGVGPTRTRAFDELRALLSQPNPTAEPTCTCGHPMDEHDLSETGECQVAIPWCACAKAVDATEPPRIEHMAPGTTFVGRDFNDLLSLWTCIGDGYVRSGMGSTRDIAAIDPYTIRDVQPPKDAA